MIISIKAQKLSTKINCFRTTEPMWLTWNTQIKHKTAIEAFLTVVNHASVLLVLCRFLLFCFFYDGNRLLVEIAAFHMHFMSLVCLRIKFSANYGATKRK